MPQDGPFRVLSLDGGGMRGTYTATYLACLAENFGKRVEVVRPLDIGAAFDLIVGTSTGGIVGCALALGIPLSEVVSLYRRHGSAIFPRKLPRIWNIAWDLFRRPSALRAGNTALKAALLQTFGDSTLAEVYTKRRIALAFTAVELSQHRSWIFKTPHLSNTNHRDDNYKLVDVCLATSAAPIYRSLAAIDHPNGPNGEVGVNFFSDGGLWANNPVLVGMIEALEMAKERAIEVYCIGTCPLPAGEVLARTDVDRGLPGWRFGGAAAGLSIDAQQFAYDEMARMLAKHVNRECSIIRFPSKQAPAALMPFLGLDDTRPEAIDALINQARTDADFTNSHCNVDGHREGGFIKTLFTNMTEIPEAAATPRE